MWSSDVLKLELAHPEEGICGYLYLDLFPRAGKFHGSATFAITYPRLTDTGFQLPRAALVSNIASPPMAPVLLRHSEVENLYLLLLLLFCGICLTHATDFTSSGTVCRICWRARASRWCRGARSGVGEAVVFQSRFRMRCVLDFVEVPSSLMEYFVWDYRFVHLWARHHSTGEVIPEALFRRLAGAKRMFVALETQTYLVHALLDQQYHGPHPLPASTTQILASLQERHSLIPHADGTHWQARFSHLTNYGSIYYVYLYCKSLAANVSERLACVMRGFLP